MKRSWKSDGKRGTVPGCSGEGTTPLQAIWSVIQSALLPAAAAILCVMSPTTLMSLLDVPACTPGGYEIG